MAPEMRICETLEEANIILSEPEPADGRRPADWRGCLMPIGMLPDKFSVFAKHGHLELSVDGIDKPNGHRRTLAIIDRNTDTPESPFFEITPTQNVSGMFELDLLHSRFTRLEFFQNTRYPLNEYDGLMLFGNTGLFVGQTPSRKDGQNFLIISEVPVIRHTAEIPLKPYILS